MLETQTAPSGAAFTCASAGPVAPQLGRLERAVPRARFCVSSLEDVRTRMNISSLRTREKGASTLFGAAALNERSRLVTENANKPSSLTANLDETTRQRQPGPNYGETDPLI